MFCIVVTVLALSGCHALLGFLNVCLGIVAGAKAGVWVAHTMSPIWSGIIYTITGGLGIVCAKKRTANMIMCFTAFSIISMVTAVISIQLLRMGLENNKYKKANNVITAAITLVVMECFVCIISAFVSCRLAKAAKKCLEQKHDGTFNVQANGDDQDNNNKVVVYTVGKGYHNSILAAETSKRLEEEAVHYQDSTTFTDLSAIMEENCNEQCDDTNCSDNIENKGNVGHSWIPATYKEHSHSPMKDNSTDPLSESSVSSIMTEPFASYTSGDNEKNDYIDQMSHTKLTVSDHSEMFDNSDNRTQCIEMQVTQNDGNNTNTGQIFSGKTVTFSTEADQVLHLSPIASLTNSPCYMAPRSNDNQLETRKRYRGKQLVSIENETKSNEWRESKHQRLSVKTRKYALDDPVNELNGIEPSHHEDGEETDKQSGSVIKGNSVPRTMQLTPDSNEDQESLRLDLYGCETR